MENFRRALSVWAARQAVPADSPIIKELEKDFDDGWLGFRIIADEDYPVIEIGYAATIH